MELWTGIACLVADPNCKDFRRFGDDGKGAYVNIVAWASSGKEFRSRVEKIVQQNGNQRTSYSARSIPGFRVTSLN
jgi:hypothetical protein